MPPRPSRRSRSVSPAWAARNSRAQNLGYRNYSDYRTHDYGRIPANQPGLSGEDRERAFGHRGKAAMDRYIDEGSTVSVWNRGERNAKGQYSYVDFLVTNSVGKERMFRLRGREITTENLDRMVSSIEAQGAVVNPSPSLDISDLANDISDYEYEEDLE